MPLPNGIKSWDEVVGSPEFHALSSQDQQAAKQEYFDSVVAPQVGDANQIEAARSEFMNDLSDPGSMLQALTNNFVKEDAPQAGSSGEMEAPQVKNMGPLTPDVIKNEATNFAKDVVRGQIEKIAGPELDAFEKYAQMGGQIAGNVAGFEAGGPMGSHVGGVAGGTIGRAISELSQMIRGKKEANLGNFEKSIGAGSLESIAGEVGGKLLGFLGKFKPIAKVLGAGAGAFLGGEAGEKLAPGDNKTVEGVSKGIGATTGAVAGFLGPEKLTELGVRALGNVSRFAAERISQRGADVVLDEAKMNPGFFNEVANKAGDIFNDLKEEAYRRFQSVADKVKWSPDQKFDAQPIIDSIRKELTKLGALNRKGDAAKETMLNSTPQVKKLMEIYQSVRGNEMGKIPRRYMDFKTASQLMNYLDNAIPEYTYGDVTKAASPFVGTLKSIRGMLSSQMKGASPVLSQAFDDYSRFADMRDEIVPLLKHPASAESQMRNILNGKNNAKRESFESMLRMHPQGQQIIDDLYDASAAKEFYNYTVGGKTGIGKEMAEAGLRGAGKFSKAVRPIGKAAKGIAKTAAPATISGLLQAGEGQ